MVSVTYENSTKEITLELAIRLYQKGIATIINDGENVTFEIE